MTKQHEFFRRLSATEEEKFRKWARDNFNPKETPDLAWHPVVRDEWQRLSLSQEPAS